MTTETAEQTFTEGDLVVVDREMWPGGPLGVYEIETVPRGKGYVNYVAKQVNPETKERIPGARGVKGKAFLFQPYDPTIVPHVVTTLTFAPGAGTVVKVNPIWNESKIGADDLYVVTTNKGDTANVTRLGGDPNGRYWPSVPAKMLTEVPLSELKDLL